MAEVDESALSVVAEASPLGQAMESALIVVAEQFEAERYNRAFESALVVAAEAEPLARAFESALIVVASSSSGPSPGGGRLVIRSGCCRGSHYSL